MATSLNLEIGLVVGFFGGVWSFFKGFGAYRESRLLQDTPEMPIRSIAMGPVRIHGKARSEHPVSSPISHTPCCFYVVDIMKWKGDEQRGGWTHYGTEADGVRFYLEDSSGRVLVDPRGAEYDIEKTLVREAPSTMASSFAAPGASDTELREYVTRVGPSPERPGPRHNLELERARVALKSLKQPNSPEERLEVDLRRIEILQEALGPQLGSPGEDMRLARAQLELSKHPLGSPEYMEGMNRVLELLAQDQVKDGSGHEPPAQPIPPASEAAAPPTDVPAAELPFVGFPVLAADRYRFVEHCILPDHEYDITGTCAENIEAKDANDRNLIKKGVNEPTYLISGLGRSDVNAMVQWRSHLMIFGGGVLAVVCLMLLLLRFGLF